MSFRATLHVLFVCILTAGCGAPSSPRICQNLNGGWKFVRQEIEGGDRVGLDDSAWQSVKLPHTWNGFDGQDGGKNYYRGSGWYRRRLNVPGAYAGKSLFLRFDGAATVTDVLVNGKRAGAHRGNFGAFCFDVTDLLRPGDADNLLAVRVDNSAFEDVAPLSGDFTICGGVYRAGHLLGLDPLSISPLDEASPGVYLRPLRVDPASADVEVTVKLRNANDVSRSATVTCAVADAGGAVIRRATVQQMVPPHGDADAVTRLHIDRPHLWNGRKDPYLYRATFEVSCDGKVTDRVMQPLGLRSFHVDGEYGLILNGRGYPLHGVNR